METGKWQMESNDLEVLKAYILEQRKIIESLNNENLILKTRIRFFEEDNKRLRII